MRSIDLYNPEVYPNAGDIQRWRGYVAASKLRIEFAKDEEEKEKYTHYKAYFSGLIQKHTGLTD